MNEPSDIESLAALMRDDPTTALLEVDPRQIDRDEDQPRHTFDQDELSELAESIRAQGVIQPLVVQIHPSDPDRYLLVAGERRLRAAIQAALATVPIIVRVFADDQRLAIQLIENLDRSPLDVLEESQAVARLLKTFGKTAREVAEMLGKSQSWVSIRKKIGENLQSVDVFVPRKTTDPETLSMLVDLERLSPGRYGEFMCSERVARSDVRMALDLAKHIHTGVRADPAPLPVPPPTVAPPVAVPGQDEVPEDPEDLLPALTDEAPLTDAPEPTPDAQPGVTQDDNEESLIPASAWGSAGSGATTPAAPPAREWTAPRPKDTNDEDDDEPGDQRPAPRPAPPKRPAVADTPPPPAGIPLIEGKAQAACRKAEQAITEAWNLKARAVLSGKDEEGELRISFRDLSDLKNLVECLGSAE